MLMEKTFTKEQMYERMKYCVWCFELGQNIKSCSSHLAYQGFLKDTKYHFGDCTKEPCSCLRCQLHEIEIEAQNIVDLMWGNHEGHCGKICLTECEGIER